MDSWDVLEAMATASYEQVTESDISKWQHLFGYSRPFADKAIKTWRADISRETIPDSHWQLKAIDLLPLGWNKEAYEYSLHIKKNTWRAPPKDQSNRKTAYLLKLEEPISSPSTLQSVIGCPTIPQCFNAIETDPDNERRLKQHVTFCHIDAVAKYKLIKWASEHYPGYRLTIVRDSRAPKDFSPKSKAPYLGLDCTLPQHKPDEMGLSIYPQQHEYPVWYFFYGKLANPNILQRLLDLPDRPRYVPATVSGARIMLWAGKFNALVDGSLSDSVHGSAYLLTSQGHEDALRLFETDHYEIVRCSIAMEKQIVQGLVFRYCGEPELLT